MGRDDLCKHLDGMGANLRGLARGVDRPEQRFHVGIHQSNHIPQYARPSGCLCHQSFRKPNELLGQLWAAVGWRAYSSGYGKICVLDLRRQRGADVFESGPKRIQQNADQFFDQSAYAPRVVHLPVTAIDRIGNGVRQKFVNQQSAQRLRPNPIASAR